MKRILSTLLASIIIISTVVPAFADTTKTTTVTAKAKLNRKNVTLKPTKYQKNCQIRIFGQVGKASFKSTNPKVAKVTAKGKVTALKKGKAKIKVQTNGQSLSLKVTVKKATKFDKLGKYKISCNQTKKSITLNVGELPYNLTDNAIDFSANCNFFELYKKGKVSSLKKLFKLDKEYRKCVDNRVYYDIKDKSIATCPTYQTVEEGYNVLITPKKPGTTTLTIYQSSKVYKIKIKVTKVSEQTYKGKLAKATYSYKETYNAIKDSFYNYLIKGKAPKYNYLICYYNISKTPDKIVSYARSDYENGQNPYLFLYNPFKQPLYDVTTDTFGFCQFADSDRGYNYSVIEIQPTQKQSKLNKIIYNEAQKILKDINIISYREDYQKLSALAKWFKENVSYNSAKAKWIESDESTRSKMLKDGSYTPSEYGSEYEVIIEKTGVCGDWAKATNYFCTLLNIPCYYVSSESGKHAWNVVKVQGKWYHMDILWDLMFFGEQEIAKVEHHTEISLTSYGNIGTEAYLKYYKNIIEKHSFIQS